MTEHEIIALAARQYAEGGKYRNPYGLNAAEFNAYERGWMQALKRDNARQLSEAPTPAPTPSVAQKPSVNLYEIAKGRRK